MKKIRLFGLLLALLLCLSVCACGADGAGDEDTSAEVEDTSAATEDGSSATSDSTKGSEEYTGNGIGDNDKDNLVSITDLTNQ